MTTTTHPDVNLGPCVLLPFEDLRCGVWWRPTPRGQLLARRIVVAEPEVCNLDVHVAVHQQVLGLQACEGAIKFTLFSVHTTNEKAGLAGL